MRNIYFYFYSRFYFFLTEINESKLFSAMVSSAIIASFPLINFMAFIHNFFDISYAKNNHLYVAVFVVFYILNLAIFVFKGKYLEIEEEFAIPRKSKRISNIVVAVYMFASLVILFL